MGRRRNQTPLADRVLDALRRAAHTCTRGELGSMYLPQARAVQIQAALDDLVERGEVERVWVGQSRPGRRSSWNPTGWWSRWEYRAKSHAR